MLDSIKRGDLCVDWYVYGDDEVLNNALRRLKADGWHILSFPSKSYASLLEEGSATYNAIRSAVRDGADIRYIKRVMVPRATYYIAMKSKSRFDELEQCVILDLIADRTGDS